jgi:hypothetical protein
MSGDSGYGFPAVIGINQVAMQRIGSAIWQHDFLAGIHKRLITNRARRCRAPQGGAPGVEVSHIRSLAVLKT